MRTAPETCPNCGADIPQSARVCPECGSCEETGWSEDTYLDGVSLPEEEFDYDEYVRKEFGENKPQVVPKGLHWFWWLVAILVVLAFILLVLL
jgi:hypothetical protein